MPSISETFRRVFRKIARRRPKQPVPPVVPSAIITPEHPSATDSNPDHQVQFNDSHPSTSPIQPAASSATGSQHVQQKQSGDGFPLTTPANHQQLSAAESLWDQAYNALAKENPGLVKKYDKLLEKEEQMANLAPNETTPTPLTAPHGHDTRVNRSPRQMQLDIVIQTGLQRMEANKTTFSIAGHEFVLKDQIAKAAKLMLWGREMIGIAVKNSPEASIVWSGVSLILPLLTNPTTADEANRDGFAYVTSRMDYYAALEPMLRRLGRNAGVDNALISAANAHLVSLYQAILDFQLSSVLRFYQSHLKTYAHDTVSLRDWKETLVGIKTREQTVNNDFNQINNFAERERLESLDKTSERLRAIMEDCLSVAMQHMDVSKKHLAAELAAQEDAKQEKLLAKQHNCLQSFWLKRDAKGATYDWYKDRVESRVEGTCKWFLQHKHFREWLSQESGPLLVSADPGCGKSVLAKYLIDHELAQRSATICYFFFKDQDQNTIRQALCALLHQLFSQKEALIRHAMELYNKMGANLVESEPSLWTILKDAVRDLQAGSVILVIDALDECDQSQLSSWISNLEDMFRDKELADAKFKVLMTSRPYEQVVSKVYRNLHDDFPRIHIPGEEEGEAISQEIDCVIHHRVEQLAKSHRLSDKIKSSLSSKLLAIKHRTYLWVYLVFDFLDEKGFKRTGGGIDAAIQALPRTVNEAYDKILKRSQEDGTVEAAKKALSIILAARRPLALSEMNIAMNLDDQGRGRSIYDLDLEEDGDFKSRLRDLCGLFVHVHHDRIYFLHQTAREFLLQPSAPTTISSNLKWHQSITTRHAHSVLAEVCMLYLDRLNSTDAKAFSEVDHQGALSKYSVEYWGDHCREAEFEISSVMVDLASELCTTDLTSHSQWASIISNRYFIRSESITNVLVASHFGLTPVTKLLLGRGADIEAKDSRDWTALKHAARSGHEPVARLLLDKGADVEARDNAGWTALMCAAKFGHEPVAQLLLDKGADVEARDNEGWTALMYAAYSVYPYAGWKYEADKRLLLNSGDILEAKRTDGTTALVYDDIPHRQAVLQMMLDERPDMEGEEIRGLPAVVLVGQYLMHAADACPEAFIRLLLDKGANVEAKNNDGQTALMIAAKSSHESNTQLLLDKGPDVESRDNDGLTALMHAADCGHEAVTRLLLDCGAQVETRDDEGWRALMYAARSGHESVTRLLLDIGADIAARDDDGWTAFMYAANCGHELVAQLLLAKGAEVDARENNGRTALMLAAKSGHEGVTRLLLENGSNIEGKKNDGETALMLAADFGHESAAQLLLANGANVETKDDDGWIALMYAARSGHVAVIRLLGKGANVEASGNDGETALMLAADCGHEAVTRLLLDYGAQVETRDDDGWIALMYAARSGHEPVAQLLLAKGADVEARENNGWTALMQAAAGGHEAVISLLLEKGANVEAKNNDGETALMVATEHGHEPVTRLLFDYGAQVEAKDVEKGT